MIKFLKILAVTAVVVPAGFAAFFGFMMWPSLVFGYNAGWQMAWLLFVFVVFTALMVWLEGGVD